MKRWLCTFLALSAIILLVPASQVHARPIDSSVPPVPVISAPAPAIAVTQPFTGTEDLTGTVRIATALATHFDRSVAEILALHAAEWGFGNIAKALFTSVEANVPLEDILKLRELDIGWGEIRESLGLFPGMPRQSLGQIVGRGNGKDPGWAPPGLAKKQDPNWVPPGQAKQLEKNKGKPW